MRRAVALWAVAGAVAGSVLTTPGPALAAPGDSATDSSERPVHIVLERLEPRTVTPGATIEVSGSLVNDSDVTYRNLAVRLQRGDQLTSRSALAGNAADPDDATAGATEFQPIDTDLDPGDERPFSFTASSAELQLPGDGVYPLLVNVNGTGADGQTERIAELPTYLIAQPEQPVHKTTVAWLWPFVDRPHRDVDGAFTDDALAGEVARGGRLERAVRTLEQLPLPPGDGTRPAVPVTLAVDPALLEELSVMAAGRYTVAGHAGTGTAAAADLLDRLRTLAAKYPVLALPYADADVDSLVTAGLAQVAARTLPGTSDGTARQPLDADQTPATAATTSEGAAASGAGGNGSDGAASGSDGAGAGAAVVRSVLGAQPITDIAWPTGGAVHPETLTTLQRGGVRSVVLASGALAGAGPATGEHGGPAAASAPLAGTDGPLTALVADDQLADAVAGAAQAENARLSEQRYLAYLGVLTGQLADDDPATPQTVLVVPPRELDADPEWISAMMIDTNNERWLLSASLEDLVAGPRASPVTATAPAADRGLATAGIDQIGRAARVRDDVADAVAGDADTALAGYDAAVARASSSSWRGDAEGMARATADLVGSLGKLRDQVTLISPANGTYSLASSDAPLVLTVQNDLPFAVDVRVDLRTRGNVGFTTGDMGVTQIEPQSRATLRVPANVRQSGGFVVTAQLYTPGDRPLGDAVQLRVKSTAYGRITVWLTVGAAALLGLLFLRRLVRFLLSRRRGEPTGDQAESATVPLTRSPV